MRTFGSLFAGIGGFDLGFHRAGLSCAWQVEIDAAARGVLAYHWPDVARLTDVCDCGAHNLAPVDILTFGFPCQDLSVAGNRAGLTGARSGLFYEATRIADELRPDLLVWENVPGLLSSRSGRDFLAVLTELERIGYCGAWTTLDAQWFGVAQRRQRLFGVFARRDLGARCCTEILSLAARMPGHSQESRTARPNITRGITASAGHHGRSSPRGDGGDNLIALPSVVPTLGKESYSPTKSSSGQMIDFCVVAPAIAQSNRGGASAVAETLRSDCHGAQPMVFGGNSSERGGNAALTAHPGGRYDFESENFVGGAQSAAYTLNATEVHAVQSSALGVRRLTPRECERLQGFPDDWTAWGADGPQSDSARYRQLGNAVAVPCAQWIGQRILAPPRAPQED